MKFVASLRKRYVTLAILPVAALLTACGGNPEDGDPMFEPAKQLHGSTTASSGKRAPAQGEFNLDIWNEHRWYECDCGRESAPPVPG